MLRFSLFTKGLFVHKGSGFLGIFQDKKHGSITNDADKFRQQEKVDIPAIDGLLFTMNMIAYITNHNNVSMQFLWKDFFITIEKINEFSVQPTRGEQAYRK